MPDPLSCSTDRATTVGRVSRSEHLVRAVDLRRALAQRGSEASPGNERPPATGRPVLLLDVRWRLTDRAGADRERHAVGHLRGARFLDLEQVLTTHSDDPRDGRHPLPDVETLEHGLGALGVEVVDDVVVYDEPGSFAAARAWWVLRWAGIRARVLDGGLPAWVEIGGPLEAGDEVTWGATTPRLTPGHLPTLTADDAATRGQRAVLLDARAPERYRGEVEPLDPRAGHIPGAVNVPAARLLTGSGTLLPDDELRAALGGLSASGDVAAYCGSGVSAAQDVLALAVLDVEAALFPGSWSAWSNDPQRPAATGALPG